MKPLFAGILICLSVGLAGAPTSGVTTCPTSGTKTILATSAKAATYTIQAAAANTGYICFGGSNITTSTGPCLNAGLFYTPPTQGNSAAYDLSTVFIACSVNTDKIAWVYQ
jgi:hypothetical protein